jgi:hypothetical protein
MNYNREIENLKAAITAITHDYYAEKVKNDDLRDKLERALATAAGAQESWSYWMDKYRKLTEKP